MRNKQKTLALLFFIHAGASYGANALPWSCSDDSSSVCIGQQNQVMVTNAISLPPERVKNLLGVHSLYWGVQQDLSMSSGYVSSAPKKILSESGASIIRYGGGVNEINWRDCIGPQAKRKSHKVVSWLGNIPCKFGIAEYESLNDDLNLNSSWYVANLVGFYFKDKPTNELALSASDFAETVLNLSQKRTRYWEMGNELERGRLMWDSSKIIARTLPIANAIKKVDPEAKIIVPLVEYQPAWIVNSSQHNESIIAGTKNIASGYSLHMYYDNPPAGPSVRNRIAYISSIASTLKNEGAVTPAIWITEHARWPSGSSLDSNWSGNWYQTGNMDAVLSTADFIIGLTQVDAVAGAMWHGLRAGPWNFIEKGTSSYSVSKSNIAQLFSMVNSCANLYAMKTYSVSEKNSDYFGGYKHRSVVFKDISSTDPLALKLFSVNRSSTHQVVTVTIDSITGSNKLNIVSNVMVAGSQSRSLVGSKVATSTSYSMAKDGVFKVTLPASSVSVMNISTAK